MPEPGMRDAVRGPIPARAAQADVLAPRVERALRTALRPTEPVLLVATPTAAAAAALPAPSGPWAISPWSPALALAAAGTVIDEQVLVLAEAPPPDDRAVARLLDGLAGRGASQVLLVVEPGSASAAAIRHGIERRAFECGFRKSPRYYLAVDFESLHEEQGPVVLALERIPDTGRAAYPAARELHPDMLREAGERSDAYLVRYQLAATLVRPGDRVLDAACGLGCGSHLLAAQTTCSSVLGVDASGSAVDYAQRSFGVVDGRLVFASARLPEGLADLPDASFDVIVSFETLDHGVDPRGLLQAFERLLAPGGRIIVGVADRASREPDLPQAEILDTLRLAFRSRFREQALHMQIASGCRARAHGDRWVPRQRVLRELPVDTRMVPDAEWWLLSGTKPAARPAVDLRAPWYEAAPRPWSDAVSGAPIAAGLVLAVNCTPADADPAVPAFWRALSAALAERGLQLVIASTAVLEDPSLQVIDIPFQLTDFPARYGRHGHGTGGRDEAEVMDAVRWYGCSQEQATTALAVAGAFFADLLDTLRPTAVLGWQSANPVSRVLRRCARARDLPYWSGERGWVRDTLMFDLGENNALSETRLSGAFASLREQAAPSAATVAALEARARQAADLARYPGLARIDGAALREKLGIPADGWVVALFTHGEPGLNTLDNATLRELHGMSAELLQQRLDRVTDAVLARGGWLLVQEHPFNVACARTLRLKDAARVIRVAENASSVLDAADHHLFTLATLQFDAAFLGKPFGLLSRSPLYRAGVPPLLDDYPNADDFLDALTDAQVWPARRARLQADIAFLFEHFLLDIRPEAAAGSAARWAEHLRAMARPLDAGFPARIERFLANWGAPCR